MMKKVVFIGGTAYSGSTMLDMILSNDEKGYSLGEVNALFRPYRAHHFLEINEIKKGDVWKRLLEGGDKEFYKNIFKSFPEIDFLVDSSKDPFWIAEQKKILVNAGIEVKNILIYKTPFEIAYSFKKRNLYEKWERSWVNYYRLYFSMIDDFRAISYKEFVTNPKSIEKICEFIGIQYFKNKHEFWNKEQYTFFGNNRTRRHTSNLELKGEEKHNIDKKGYRRIFYEKISDIKILKEAEEKTNKNYFISLVLSTLIDKSKNGNNTRIPPELTFCYYQIFIRKLKDKILIMKAIIKNYNK